MMKMTTQMPTTMEILSMARNLLIDRYQEEKSRCVLRWQMLNDYAWNTNGDIMACPDMPEYPTADEILALARHIYTYFQEQEPQSTEVTSVTPVESKTSDSTEPIDESCAIIVIPVESATGNITLSEPAAENTMPVESDNAMAGTEGPTV